MERAILDLGDHWCPPPQGRALVEAHIRHEHTIDFMEKSIKPVEPCDLLIDIDFGCRQRGTVAIQKSGHVSCRGEAFRDTLRPRRRNGNVLGSAHLKILLAARWKNLCSA